VFFRGLCCLFFAFFRVHLFPLVVSRFVLDSWLFGSGSFVEVWVMWQRCYLVPECAPWFGWPPFFFVFTFTFSFRFFSLFHDPGTSEGLVYFTFPASTFVVNLVSQLALFIFSCCFSTFQLFPSFSGALMCRSTVTVEGVRVDDK